MKKILPLILLIIPFISYSQNFTSVKDSLKALKDTIYLAHPPIDAQGVITYKLIEDVPGVSKKELYDRAKIWSALTFKSSKNVIQLDDTDGGTIIIQALTEQFFVYKVFGTPYPARYNLHFSVHFSIKENKYRLIISSFNIETFVYPYATSSNSALEVIYKNLREWNINAKNGQMQFNRTGDLGGPHAVKPQFEIINNLDAFATGMLADVKKALSKPAKADDF